MWRVVGALGAGVLMALLVGELIARGAQLERRWLPDLAYYQGVDVSIHRPSAEPGLVYELLPGAELSVWKEEVEGVEEEMAWWTEPRVMKINRLGHRGPERSVTKPPGTFRVLALGGSNTFGAAVSNGESWPGALERALSERVERPVEVWNLGVNGYVTSQKVTQAREAIERFAPDLLLFQIYNTGPRNILLREDVDPVATFRAEPSLYWETLLWSPSPEQPVRQALWSVSHLYRAVVLGLNRRARVDEKGKFGSPLEELDNRSEAQADRMFREFLEEEAAGLPVWILYGAEGPGPGWCDVLEVPRIELDRELDIPELPGARHIHPSAEVYTWYGQKIAERLIRAGCLADGCAPERR